MEPLAGRVALVTGGSRGIGRACAIALAQAGASVAVNYLSRSQEAAQVVNEIHALGKRAIAIQADVSVASEVQRLVDIVRIQLGPVEIPVNNAGIARPQPPEAVSEQDWDEVLRVNLKSAFLVSQAVLGPMRARRWGRIIMISSVAAHLGGIVGPHYAASKAGMLGMVHYYARVLAKEGITVNCVSPALIETEMVTSNPNASPDLLPVGRYGKPEEVAQAVVLLASNGFITGQTVHVNGGWYMT